MFYVEMIESSLSLNDSFHLIIKMKSSYVKKETIVIEEEEDVVLAKESDPLISNMQNINSGNYDHNNNNNNNNNNLDNTRIDRCYMMLLDSFREDHVSSYLRDNPLRSIRYDVDNGSYDKRLFSYKKIREDSRNTKKPHVVSRGRRRRRRNCHVAEKSVDAMHVKTRLKKHIEKDNLEQGTMVVDDSYKAYLVWLVENSKRSKSEKERQEVKCEEETMSDSGSGIIAVQDRPFLDEEESPFVPSKNYQVIDLEEKKSDDQRDSWFKKEIIGLLKKPYNGDEFKELYNEASVRRALTKCRELRDGREFDYQTKDTRPSYLDMYPKFKRMLHDSLNEKDQHKALNLLRGFIFYLTKVARDDAFKPWRNLECLKIRCS